ncbi:UDP-glucose 4-epimerase GalE [Candidatus Microgenomates bacterium]|nr:UDP-glucose 4-epimerase GalE [Candidatus Microgenomates bacterium]
MNILVTGGAGYIGSFTVRALKEAGHEIVVFDDLDQGHENSLPEKVKLVKGSLEDAILVEDTVKKERIEAVMHFASRAQVGESMRQPGKYFKDNVLGTVNLLEAMQKAHIYIIVFSSSAAVYGNPTTLPIPEDHSQIPTNVYGETKVMIEKLLYWYHEIHNINSISIRYFNAAGGAFDGSLGEDHKNESHIIPLAIHAALSKSEFTLNGDDYPTKDGTCIRDYVHVLDLVEAHMLALKALENGSMCVSYNAATGNGFSNKEIVEMVKQIAGDFKVKIGPRREGDPAELVADSSKLQKELGWKPKYSDLETIVKTAYLWHSKHPRGYTI